MQTRKPVRAVVGGAFGECHLKTLAMSLDEAD